MYYKLYIALGGDVLDQQLRAKLGNRRCKWKREEDDMVQTYLKGIWTLFSNTVLL